MAQIFGERWQVQEGLTESGQSWTYLVIDITEAVEGLHVLKRLRNPRRLERFAQEIGALQNLNHENIVSLVDFNLEEERPWFVQEYCPGGDLQNYVIGHKDLDPDRALGLFIQATSGLVHAHDKGKIHRDIKPANVFLRAEHGPAVLGDFGLCWTEDSGERLTLTEEAVGSFHYMAPELRDGRVDEPSWRGDIYSLGKVLYFMLSGGRSFDREIHREEGRNLVTLRGDYLMEHVNYILDKMITFEPDERSPAKEVLDHALSARKLIGGAFSPLSTDVLTRCSFCGVGVYKPIADSDGAFQSFFGFLPGAVSNAKRDWRMLACDHCGNIKFFALSQSKSKWWPGQV